MQLRLRLSMIGLIIDGGSGQLVKKLSRSRKIIKIRKTLAPVTSMLRTSLLTNSLTSATEIAVKYDGVDSGEAN